MRRLSLTAAALILAGASFVAGMRAESITHAYHVHEVTGASLLQVIGPDRLTLTHEAAAADIQGDDEENCDDVCESNQE